MKTRQHHGRFQSGQWSSAAAGSRRNLGRMHRRANACCRSERISTPGGTGVDVSTGWSAVGNRKTYRLAKWKEAEAEGTEGMDDRRDDGRGAQMASAGAGGRAASQSWPGFMVLVNWQTEVTYG